ncbi:MAG: HXXEE domain-containing protein [Terracidiphilus sp.]|jgi:hypothetical protein
MSFRSLEWLFPIVITLHNAEEAIWFPDWTKRAGRWYRPGPVAPGVFRFAVAIFTLLAFAVTWLSYRSGKETLWTYLAFGYMAAALANVLIPHLAATVLMRRYMPGVATGVALNLPVLSLLVAQALRQGYVSGGKAAAYSVVVAGVLLLAIPALFRLGKALNLGERFTKSTSEASGDFVLFAIDAFAARTTSFSP